MLRSLFLLIGFAANITAQTNTPVGQQVTPDNPAHEAPAIVTTRFASEFPGTNATWSRLGENYAANFTESVSNLRRMVVYDSFGKQLSQITEVPSKKQPKPLQAYFKTNYPDTSFTVWSQRDHRGNELFFSVNGRDSLYFDKSGKPLSGKGGK